MSETPSAPKISTWWICFWLVLILMTLGNIDNRGRDIAKELKRMNDREEKK